MILVTGAAGYVGSHFVKYCLENSTENILAVDNLSTGHYQALPKTDRVVFFQIDIGNQKRLREILQQFPVSTVVHFAALANARQSQEEPFEYYQNNVVAAMRLFEVLEEHRIRKVVYSSSCSVYGSPQYLPIDEKHPTNPITVYGTSKLLLEKILESLVIAKAWSAVSLRYFNAAGASLDGSIGESHNPEPHLIPRLFDIAEKKSKYLEIYGNNWDTADGTAIRDYIHVNDLAAAHMTALQFINESEPGNYVFNLGTAKGHSILEMIHECERVAGASIATKIIDKQAGDVSCTVADHKKAAQQLHWTPKLNLSDILSSAWRWHQSRKY